MVEVPSHSDLGTVFSRGEKAQEEGGDRHTVLLEAGEALRGVWDAMDAPQRVQVLRKKGHAGVFLLRGFEWAWADHRDQAATGNN